LLILTEVHRTLAIDGYGGLFSSPAPADSGYLEVEAAVGIFHRWPCTPRVEPIDELRNLALCLNFSESPIGPLVVYGSIIPYQQADVRCGARAWQRNRESAQRQTADWRALADRPDLRDHRLIVGGDFNTTLDGKSYGNPETRSMLERAFDGPLECLTREDFYPVVGRHTILHLAIDSRLAENTLAKASTWHNPREQPGLSDHNGVTVTLIAK